MINKKNIFYKKYSKGIKGVRADLNFERSLFEPLQIAAVNLTLTLPTTFRHYDRKSLPKLSIVLLLFA